MPFDPYETYRVNLPPGMDSAAGLPSSYALHVTLQNGTTVEIGRFSLAVLFRLILRTRPGDGLVFSCGALCEPADCKILVGGDHDNDSLWNVALQGVNEVFGHLAPGGAMQPTRPTVLADNVLLGQNALVRSGVRIGVGAVIGAGAVVTRDCDPFGIYAGSPASKLRERFGPERQAIYRALRLSDLHAHHLPDVPALVKQIEAGELSIDDYLSRVSFLRARPKLHLTATHAEIGVQITGLSGASIDGEMVDDATFRKLVPYFTQTPAQDIDWRPDIFHAMGLC